MSPDPTPSNPPENAPSPTDTPPGEMGHSGAYPDDSCHRSLTDEQLRAIELTIQGYSETHISRGTSPSTAKPSGAGKHSMSSIAATSPTPAINARPAQSTATNSCSTNRLISSPKPWATPIPKSAFAPPMSSSTWLAVSSPSNTNSSTPPIRHPPCPNKWVNYIFPNNPQTKIANNSSLGINCSYV